MLFNNVNLIKFFRIYSIEKGLLPSLEPKDITLPNLPGKWFLKQQIGSRDITVHIRMIGETPEEREKNYLQLAEVLYTEEPQKLVLDNKDRYFMAEVVDTTPIIEISHSGKATIVFRCFDPFAYSETETVVTDLKSIDNKGSYPTVGILKISIIEDVDHLRITQRETGEYIHLATSLKNGDEVLVDLGIEMITKNGISVMADIHLESDFFKIPKGRSVIELSSGIGELRFRERRWL